ncbi:MAG: hypothetical protein H6573_22810 [Lewinellaceae bacterium]|nr:hypothetical protein [Lewinellaceae bacterium]
MKKDPNISTKGARRAANATAKEVMKSRTGQLSTVKVTIQSGSVVSIEAGVQTVTSRVDENVGDENR